ncbi:MAG: hypothetical protein Q7J43_12255 [Pseudomonas sp.]|uniref:hypothetical protein n=1 Tax=Pseudomonas sp. TaxID=306 RepID=UPI002727F405|nr:hypothetical protein [Pseudomonas sp.]MDO9618436.1 hypothetical protein [Pseudomonas sp.]MDP2445421.1 hypothetical protein [Pseudomonas sp.]MDZ4332625.1 hypothetical protein [Pseudomonas sp.]
MYQMLKNYLRCHRGVKNRLKCSFTARKLRFSPVFALRWLPRQRFSTFWSPHHSPQGLAQQAPCAPVNRPRPHVSAAPAGAGRYNAAII